MQGTPTTGPSSPVGSGGAPSAKPTPARSGWRRLVKPVLAFLLLAGVGHVLRTNLAQVDFTHLRLRAGWLAASAACYFIHIVSQGFIWHRLSRLCEAALPARESFRHWTYSQLGKYVPGKVARVGYLAFVYKRAGHDLHKVTAILGLEFIGNLAGVMLVISTCVLLSGASLPQGFHVAGGVLLAGSILGLHPLALNFGLNLLSRILRRPLGALRFTFREILTAVPSYAASYLFLAGANWFLYLALIGPEAAPSFALSTAVFGAAGLAGSFAFFSPGGLGAREAVLQLGLQGSLGGPLASVHTVASRAWFTLCEMSFVGGTWIFARLAGEDPRADLSPEGSDAMTP